MKNSFPMGACLMLLCITLTGCPKKADDTPGGKDGTSTTIMIDGSSTVFPISQAVAEEFGKTNKNVKVVVGTSGTGGGFKKFYAGETDINDASRPIKESEIEACKKANIEYIELKVAIDGLSVIVNPENDWVENITVAQLKQIWEPGSKVTKWSDVDSSWPAEEIKLYGPDTDSGTFDYFTDEINGEEGASRDDYTPSTDDNFLVKGISGDKTSLGYFGYAYYVENKDKLKVLGVTAGDDLSKAVKPTAETIEAGEYTPLSRPLFLYVNTAALKKPEIVAFLRYYLNEGQALVPDVGYVKLSEATLKEAKETLEKAISEAESAEAETGEKKAESKSAE